MELRVPRMACLICLSLFTPLSESGNYFLAKRSFCVEKSKHLFCAQNSFSSVTQGMMRFCGIP